MLGAGTEIKLAPWALAVARRGHRARSWPVWKRGTTVNTSRPQRFAQAQGRISIIAPTVDSATMHGLGLCGLTQSSAAFKPGMFVRGAFGWVPF